MQWPWQPRPAAYTTSLSFSVGVRPQNPASGEEAYYTALASEYLIDDLAEVVRGSESLFEGSCWLPGVVARLETGTETETELGTETTASAGAALDRAEAGTQGQAAVTTVSADTDTGAGSQPASGLENNSQNGLQGTRGKREQL